MGNPELRAPNTLGGKIVVIMTSNSPYFGNGTRHGVDTVTGE